jgi:hypothetical protein
MADQELKSAKDIEHIAGTLLGGNPGAVVRHRLLRDVFRLSPGDPLLTASKEAVLGSRWIRALALPPDVHGFEWPVKRALSLGLDMHDRFLADAADRLAREVTAGMARSRETRGGPSGWSDAVAAGSLLALIDPKNGALDELWERWLDIATASFASGRYRVEDEKEARRDCGGAQPDQAVPDLVSDRPLAILAARPDAIPPMLEELLLDRAWKTRPFLGQGPRAGSRAADAWLSALEMLSTFRLGLVFAEPQVYAIWQDRGSDGLWSRWRSPLWMLSDDWKNDALRRMDMTTRVLVYLRKNWRCG